MTAVLSKNAAAALRVAEYATDTADLRHLLRMIGLVDDRDQLLPDDDAEHVIPVIETLAKGQGSARVTTPMTVRPDASTAPEALRNLPPLQEQPKPTGRTRKPIKHGTPQGYYTHRRHKEPVCEACRDAYNSERLATRAPTKGRNAPRKTEGEYIHGTGWGYKRHLRDGEQACAPCLEAKRAEWRIKKQKTAPERAAKRAAERATKLAPCGTPAAARRHRYNGERPIDVCPACAEAERQDWKKRDVRRKARKDGAA